MRRSIVLLSLLCLFPGATAGAQYRQAPTQYTVVNVGGGQTQHFYRDGDKVLVDLTMPTSTNQPVAIHMRTIVDAPSKTQVELGPPESCGSVQRDEHGRLGRPLQPLATDGAGGFDPAEEDRS